MMTIATSPPLAREAPERIEIVVASDQWANQPGVAETAADVIMAAAALLRAHPAAQGQVDIVLTDDESIRQLNRDWRGIDKPTNVLSFPSAKLPSRAPGDPAPVPLGDIVIAYETIAREAGREEKPFMHHFAHLVAHGFLHLLGYDHDSDQAADEMEQLETAILATFDIADPYTVRIEGLDPDHHA